MKPALSVIAGLLFLAGYVPYIVSIVRRRFTPSKATWIIFAALDYVTAFAMYRAGTLNGQMVGACLGATVVMILSLKRGHQGWRLLDKVCLAGAAIGLLLSWNPAVGLVASLIVVTIGTIPTNAEAWRRPHHENTLAWLLFLTSCVTAVLAVPAWTLSGAAQPVTFLGLTTCTLGIILLRRLVVPSWQKHPQYLADLGGLCGAPPRLMCRGCRCNTHELFYGHCKSCATAKDIPRNTPEPQAFHDAMKKGSVLVGEPDPRRP